MLRTMMGSSTAIADIVPVDVCVNMMIAVAWHTGMKKCARLKCWLEKYPCCISRPKNIPVYHCSTGHLGTLTWGKVINIGLQHLDTICMENAICFPHLQFTENRFARRELLTCFHWFLRLDFVIFIFDFVEKSSPHFYSIVICGSLVANPCKFLLLLLSFNPLFHFSFFKLSDKIYKSVRTLDFFTSHSWIFPNDNSRALQNEMNDVDQRVRFFLSSVSFDSFVSPWWKI